MLFFFIVFNLSFLVHLSQKTKIFVKPMNRYLLPINISHMIPFLPLCNCGVKKVHGSESFQCCCFANYIVIKEPG